MRAPRRVTATSAALLLAFAVVVCGCSAVTGRPVPTDGVLVRPVRPSFVYGTDGSAVDTLAATVVTDAQAYWSRAYPRHFAGRWHGLDGGFFSVDTTDVSADPPPCADEVSDLAGNAFYCATVDAIAWDRAALLPVLREHHGAAAVVVVLAHEMGHAVQHRVRAGSGDSANGKHPALDELVADCYAGAYMRWVVDGHSNRLRIDEYQLDGAMQALIAFQDPRGGSDTGAHGSAFDRISAFQDGYRSGPGLCADMTARSRGLTDRQPARIPQHSNRPAEEVVRSRSAATGAYFDGIVAHRGANWNVPRVRRSPAAQCEPNGGAISYCAAAAALVVDGAELADINYEIGDQATATILASGYARAALAALAPNATGRTADRRITCLTGSYTGSLLHGTDDREPLPAGDLDEAVTAVLTELGPAAPGKHRISGFDRLAAFRAGLSGGARACVP